MGRAKLNMELISKEKSRNITFKKRKEGLIRKIQEFTILCDVSACMIIYGPKQDKGSVEPEIWPQNVDEVRRIVEIYKAKSKDSGNKTFDLSDFFKDRQRKIEEELVKLRKKNMEAKYPTSLDSGGLLDEQSLRLLGYQLRSKLEEVQRRIEMLKMNRQGTEMGLMDFSHARLSQSNYFYAPGLMQRGMELEILNKQTISQFPIHNYPMAMEQQQQEMINQNSMMLLLMNENDHSVQFGGGPSNNGNIQCASFKREIFYESGARGVDPFFCTNPMPMGRYFDLPSVTPPQQMMMQGGVPNVGLPQLTFGMESNYQEGAEEEFFKMKNNRSGYYE